MKKTVLYGALLAAALMIPTEAAELGKMKPVETVCVRLEADTITIETDTEDIGRGATVLEALENLKDTTAGTIYLDTAEYLLVMGGAEQQLPELSKYLKMSVRICKAEGDIPVKDTAAFLSAHRPAVKLKQWQKGIKLQVLKAENGRLKLK